ncbi:MAG: 50S ribosomal protein L18 [Pseudomonadota bacterium]
MNKRLSRLRRSKKTRAKIKSLGINRLSVFKTSKHIYAQIISDKDQKVIVAVNTLQGDVKSELSYTGNCNAAAVVGKIIAEKAKQAGVSKVAFDRSGFIYHGRIKSLADAARENGLDF